MTSHKRHPEVLGRAIPRRPEVPNMLGEPTGSNTMGPTHRIPRPAPPPEDGQAKREAKLNFEGKERSHKLRGLLYKLAHVTIWITIGIAVPTLVIRTWHFLAPADWGWLSDPQLALIDTSIISILVGAIIPILVGRVLQKERGSNGDVH
jgi:hypothetical protein